MDCLHLYSVSHLSLISEERDCITLHTFSAILDVTWWAGSWKNQFSLPNFFSGYWI